MIQQEKLYVNMPFVTVNVGKRMYSFKVNGRFVFKVFMNTKQKISHQFLLKKGIIHSCYEMYILYREKFNLPKVSIGQTPGGYFYYSYIYEDATYKCMCEGDRNETLYDGIFDLMTRCGHFKGLKQNES